MNTRWQTSPRLRPLFRRFIDVHATLMVTVWSDEASLGSSKASQRNASIVCVILNGSTFKATAKQHGLTIERTRQIVKRFCRRSIPDVDWECIFAAKLKAYHGWLAKALESLQT